MPKQCQPGYIINPKTNRCIKADGKVAKQLGLATSPKKASPKKALLKKASPKKALLKKVVPKKASPKKASPKKALLKKASPKKASPKKVVPKKASPKKASPKKVVKLVDKLGKTITYELPDKAVEIIRKAIKEISKIKFVTGNKNFPKDLIKKYNLNPNDEDVGLFNQLKSKDPVLAKKMEDKEEADYEKIEKIQDKAIAQVAKLAKISTKEASHIFEDETYRAKGKQTLHDQPTFLG